MRFRFKDFFFETYYYNGSEDYIENFKFLAIDFLYLKGYNPLSTLRPKKCYYFNYINIEFDLFWKRILISFGMNKEVPYELGFKEFKKRQLNEY